MGLGATAGDGVDVSALGADLERLAGRLDTLDVQVPKRCTDYKITIKLL